MEEPTIIEKLVYNIRFINVKIKNIIKELASQRAAIRALQDRVDRLEHDRNK